MHGVLPRKRSFSKCRSRSDLDNCPVPILVAYHLMTSYYFYYPSITLYSMSIKWLWGDSSNRRQYRRQCRRQSFHLLCVHNEVLGPLAMRQSHHSFYFLVFRSTQKLPVLKSPCGHPAEQVTRKERRRCGTGI